ncbi:MAG: (2E,6E)-farnesyl diphosphate synthase [Gammaproteobacteria bacterium]|nr:(2E,6E)-farnesyl diphosphate synthase [Gammaproteobacteria bacterium]
MSNFDDFMQRCQSQIEAALEQRLPAADKDPKKLHEAMRYSALQGGKRVRPMLVYAAGQAVGATIGTLDSPACAIELIHVYSLIHDDLPAMDDDDLRRGRPTCHKAFDDATAILAGDALQPLAFQILSNDEQIPDSTRIRMIQVLTQASGSMGMAGGQAIDLESEGQQLTLPALERMHARKTGALILASLQLGALSNPQTSDPQLNALETYGKHIGLAFQIKDDILDETGDTETLGKPQGSDRQRNKSTFISLCGLEASQQRADDLLQQALDALEIFDEKAGPLRQLAQYIVQRDY